MANALGVRFNATSSGTGDFVDASVITGYRRGASNLVDGATYRYRAESATLSEYEWGTGVWTASSSTLARTTIEFSSTGSKVSFTAAPQVAAVIFPQDVREILTAARTYYVRTDGSDSNSGLANSAGGAFLTWQKAINFLLASVDLGGFAVTVRAGEDTASFSAGVSVSGAFVGDNGAGVTLVGTPAVAITGATNATPIVITAAGHNFVNGKNVVIDGVAGNTAANGSFLVASANIGAGTFALTKVVDSSNVAGTGAYTSGGNAQVVDQIVISGTGRPVTVQNGATLAINGFKLASSTSQLIVVQAGGSLGTGRMSYGSPGSGIGPIFVTRFGRCIQSGSYSISASPGVGAPFVQASHTGNWRQQAGIGYAIANLTYDITLNSGFLFVDNGEIVTTASPGGTPWSANGFTVTATKWIIIENGIIQVEGSSPPLDSLIIGSINGQMAPLPSLGTTFAALPVAATSLIGARYFITDCNSTTFHATAAGGGANKVPVVCDGTQWLIG